MGKSKDSNGKSVYCITMSSWDGNLTIAGIFNTLEKAFTTMKECEENEQLDPNDDFEFRIVELELNKLSFTPLIEI